MARIRNHRTGTDREDKFSPLVCLLIITVLAALSWALFGGSGALIWQLLP